MSSLKALEEYYYNTHKNKIFCMELHVEDKEFCILYDYDKTDEIIKFVSNFTEYLPYYVYNGDALEHIVLDDKITDRLLKISKSCWDGPETPKRDAKVNGIFGEVFLDFYERIIKKNILASTYATRRDFRSNGENHGFDNVLFKINNDEIEFVFAEAKFVTSKSAAKESLINDIRGDENSEAHKRTNGHLTIEFMDDYICFIVNKNSFFHDNDKQLLKKFFNELNEVLINRDGKFAQFLIEKNIKVNCVFFAIFNNNSVNPSDYIEVYKSIEEDAKSHLEAIGFRNYYIEIVFVPTSSKSMDIKEAISKSYE